MLEGKLGFWREFNRNICEIFFESVAGNVIWVQGYGVLMVAETRVKTSSGIDGALLGRRVDAAE